jgi:hypothetical protein
VNPKLPAGAAGLLKLNTGIPPLPFYARLTVGSETVLYNCPLELS